MRLRRALRPGDVPRTIGARGFTGCPRRASDRLIDAADGVSAWKRRARGQAGSHGRESCLISASRWSRCGSPNHPSRQAAPAAAEEGPVQAPIADAIGSHPSVAAPSRWMRAGPPWWEPIVSAIPRQRAGCRC